MTNAHLSFSAEAFKELWGLQTLPAKAATDWQGLETLFRDAKHEGLLTNKFAQDAAVALYKRSLGSTIPPPFMGLMEWLQQHGKALKPTWFEEVLHHPEPSMSEFQADLRKFFSNLKELYNASRTDRLRKSPSRIKMPEPSLKFWPWFIGILQLPASPKGGSGLGIDEGAQRPPPTRSGIGQFALTPRPPHPRPFASASERLIREVDNTCGKPLA
jgi:hypothetical protein